MKTYKESKKHLLDARREADAILATGANRLLLIEAILLVCVFVVLFVSLSSSTRLLLSVLSPKNETLSPLLSNVTLLICWAFGIFFVSPVVLGLFRLAEQMQAGQRPVLMDLFYYLSSHERYVQGLRATWLGSLKLTTTVFVAICINRFFDTLSPNGVIWNWISGIFVATVICLGVLFLLFPYARLYAKLRPNEMDARASLFDAAPYGGWHLIRFFFPWLILGFVSIGLLLVLDVLPRMLLTYFCDCKRQDLNIF